MSGFARLAVLALWLTLATADAHAFLAHVEPSDDGVLAGASEALELHFTMAVEARFSRFEVYHLVVEPKALPVDLAAPSERERQRLNALAAQFAASVLELDSGDDQLERADDGTITLSEGDTVVTVGLREGLRAGPYVVVWDVLAVDAHWTNGHQLLLIAGTLD